MFNNTLNIKYLHSLFVAVPSGGGHCTVLGKFLLYRLAGVSAAVARLHLN
jgi:hypothetical protein